MRNPSRRTALLAAALLACGAALAAPYRPTWNSLRQHPTPQWLVDAKFGIYTHFSFETAQNLPGNEDKPKHELIDELKMERFDPDAWAALFQRSGAKFAGPVSWHGSGFLHWDSDLTTFDIVDRGPRRDIAGELKRSIEARNMKLIMSFHTGYWYRMAVDQDNPARLDPRYRELYGEPHDLDAQDVVLWKNHIEKQAKFSAAHQRLVLDRMKEAVTKYQPDIAWVDVSFGGTVRALNKGFYRDGKLQPGDDIYIGGLSEPHQRDYIAHLFNTGAAHGKEVEFVYKEYDVPPGVGMRNFENGLTDTLEYDVWMTDIDLCDPVSWFYKEGMGLKDENLIIDMLCDVVSKNGILLLNVPPKADGTFAEDIVAELHGIGDWLALNGEAIYGSMPWTVYGEGPSALAKTGHYSESKRNASYTEKDFRFTQKDDALYAICLGIPEGKISIRSLGSRGRLHEGDILSLSLIGSDEAIAYRQEPMELKIQMPENFSGQHACVFKIQRKSAP